MLRTIEFLGHHILKNEIVSMELLSFHEKMTRKKVILVTGVAARKRSESECLLQICQIWLNMHDMLRTIEFLVFYYDIEYYDISTIVWLFYIQYEQTIAEWGPGT